MNPLWLARNLARSWANRSSVSDFARRMAWIYSAKLPRFARRHHWDIAFRYPAPIGEIRLRVRDNSGADAFIHSEVFEQEAYKFEQVTSPSTILDLGANAGYSTIYFSRTYPAAAVACVEPIHANVAVLSKNLEMNEVRASVFEAAVDSMDGQLSMELASLDYGHRVLPPSSSASSESIQVVSISVPSLLKTLGWERIGLLKVDIEGHERIVLTQNNEWLHRVDALCVEWHDELGERVLHELALRFGFSGPKIRCGVWILTRAPVAPNPFALDSFDSPRSHREAP